MTIGVGGHSLSFPVPHTCGRIIPAMPTTRSHGGETSEGHDPESALPSVLARVLAFGSILVGGIAGGFIGYAFADLGGISTSMLGVVTFLGAVIGAGGVAVVAVLTLRALGEWRTIRTDHDPSGR